MSKEKTNSDELYQVIMARKLKEVEVALSKIDEILQKSLADEAYEDCAELRDAKLPLREYLDGTRKYEEIKDILSFVNQKIGELISAALKKAQNRNKPK